MSASAAILPAVPEDCQLVGVTQCAAALGISERKARQLLATENIPTVELGCRSRGVRLSHVRRLLARRERFARARSPAGQKKHAYSTGG